MGLKRYLVFHGIDYEAGGGWEDFQDSFDTLEEAREKVQRTPKGTLDWWHIVDSQAGQIVDKGRFD